MSYIIKCECAGKAAYFAKNEMSDSPADAIVFDSRLQADLMARFLNSNVKKQLRQIKSQPIFFNAEVVVL